MPIHAAAHWGQEEACKVLAENLCNMDTKNNNVSIASPEQRINHRCALSNFLMFFLLVEEVGDQSFRSFDVVFMEKCAEQQ